jgi:mono/diheme cytochrome c family protein
MACRIRLLTGERVGQTLREAESETMTKGDGRLPGTVILITLMVGAGVLTACGDGGGGMASTATPATGVDRGRVVYSRYCNSCHPGGGRGAGPSIQMLGSTWTDYELEHIVRQGKSRMPSFNEKSIPEPELDDLILYIRSLQKP